MTKLDLSPEGLESLCIQLRINAGLLRSVGDVEIGERCERAAYTIRALATERRNDFLAGALAMREACANAAEECDAPYAVLTPEEDAVCAAMADRTATAIRAIDPTSLTEKREPEVCEACEGHGCVATSEKDTDGFHVEVACPVCNSKERSIESLRNWLNTRSDSSWAKEFGYTHLMRAYATFLQQPVAPVVDDAMVERTVDALAQAPLHIQGFSYGQRHVIRNVRAPADKQEIWSAPALTDEDYQVFQKQCAIERMKFALEAALKGEK